VYPSTPFLTVLCRRGGPNAFNSYLEQTSKFIKSEKAAKQEALKIWHTESGVKHILDITELEADLPPAKKARMEPTEKPIEAMNITELVEERQSIQRQIHALQNRSAKLVERIRELRDSFVMEIDSCLSQK